MKYLLLDGAHCAKQKLKIYSFGRASPFFMKFYKMKVEILEGLSFPFGSYWRLVTSELMESREKIFSGKLFIITLIAVIKIYEEITRICFDVIICSSNEL